MGSWTCNVVPQIESFAHPMIHESKPSSVWAIVLAAGHSRRMGAPKLLLPLGDRPVIAWVVDALLESCLAGTMVVTGRDPRAIKAALRGRKVRCVPNPDSGGDMLSSLRCGLRALPATATAVLVALGDQPGISPALIRDLLAAHRGDLPDASAAPPDHGPGTAELTPGPAGRVAERAEALPLEAQFAQNARGIVVPTFGGRRGHPVLVSLRFRPELLSQFDGVGLRGLLQAHPREVCEVPVSSAAVLEDLDSPADYARAQRRFARTRYPIHE